MRGRSRTTTQRPWSMAFPSSAVKHSKRSATLAMRHPPQA
ncbi:hypothetical protein DIQ79_00110 [Mycolicibacterium smegmatis]|uniref:Uncharacterized protein n=1 Tax=Mycolicibacterium smegmatis (strain ATCC 700084 / mc(2)155) TaxID=246196 RepID=A0R6Z1_MYCS2|nr:hypothetical protein MSMEG_6721 [Mycolicibacterium smegmatis MC2 155]TBM53611.1 hypothetical protein DIQ86_01255 [Mycolicibacterium smegmatis]TBH52059.1 hypothetical protein EYS45_01350 [Mycolicibacterium smegmatis MC2 155]TBM57352.1 hypothetical protein DIQ85_00110 [Mycolicibacterium smegmatis]TBM68036.1 hypothetical protein DIQ83_01350 [Mycolicibacterium smegmatis]